jgi:hypothetical protein
MPEMRRTEADVSLGFDVYGASPFIGGNRKTASTTPKQGGITTGKSYVKPTASVQDCQKR